VTIPLIKYQVLLTCEPKILLLLLLHNKYIVPLTHPYTCTNEDKVILILEQTNLIHELFLSQTAYPYLLELEMYYFTAHSQIVVKYIRKLKSFTVVQP